MLAYCFNHEHIAFEYEVSVHLPAENSPFVDWRTGRHRTNSTAIAGAWFCKIKIYITYYAIQIQLHCKVSLTPINFKVVAEKLISMITY